MRRIGDGHHKNSNKITLYFFIALAIIVASKEETQMTIICINGYDQPDYCDHCGKHLIHGVRTNTHGTIGADCFVKLIKADKKRYNGNGKPTASMVRNYAMMVERRSPQRLSEMGYHPDHFRFELA